MITSSGILLVDKPAGMTSHAVVRRLKKSLENEFPQLRRQGRSDSLTGGKQGSVPRFRCGHAGSLDPLATGLLLILVGTGSRLSPFLMGLDKVYAATIRFGARTETLDREGRILEQVPVPASSAPVLACLPGFLGEIHQIPPVISALKRQGQPLYKRARRGEDVLPPPARPIRITRLELKAERWPLPAGPCEIDVEVDCSSGTYIRSLARDIGLAAGSAAYIQELRRLAVGPFQIADAITAPLEATGKDLVDQMLPLASALSYLPSMVIDGDETRSVRNGGQPRFEWLQRLSGPVPHGKSPELWCLLDDCGTLVAVCRLDQASGLPRLAAVIPAENEPCD